MNRNILLVYAFFILIENGFAQGEKKEGIIADHAMVVTAHTEASKVGIEVLKQGGNAIDATVAIQFALAVVYPNAGNIGGGGFLVLRLENGETQTLDFREKAPLAASRNMYLDSLGNVSRKSIETSQLASGVPGSVAGMWEAHQKYGSLPWHDLIQPAINLAENGFELTERQAKELNEMKMEFDTLNDGQNYLARSNEIWKMGDTLIQLHLAETLKHIQIQGRDGFYDGIIAQFIVDEMKAHNGVICLEDLKNYQPVWREPIQFNYKNYTIISMPPPSSGGIVLGQILKMIEPFSIQNFEIHSAENIHLFSTAEKLAYADRAAWLGDPDFFPVPKDSLLHKKYLENRMRLFDPILAVSSSQIAHGSIETYNQYLYESEETTHFSIVDAMGNAVSLTTTLNDSYGSRIFVTNAGFILNNEMDDFSAKPGEPNLYGLIGGEANAIEPNKRMLSSMTPTIVLKDSALFMVLGSPGGSTIITSVFQNIIHVVEYHMTMQESVDTKRVHHQWLPDEIQYEKNALTSDIKSKLIEMGYTLKERGAMGRVDAILIKDNHTLEGAADPRGDDKAIGY